MTSYIIAAIVAGAMILIAALISSAIQYRVKFSAIFGPVAASSVGVTFTTAG